MKYLAYCCLTPVSNLTLKGSKYVLENKEVEYPTSYASNEFLSDTAEFSFRWYDCSYSKQRLIHKQIKKFVFQAKMTESIIC